MATISINKIKGLSTFPNYIEGTGEDQTIANNVVIDRDNVLEPRRGMKVLSEIPDFAKQLLTYKDRVLVHYDNAIGYFNTKDPGILSKFKGTSIISVDSPSTSIKIIDHNLSVGDSVFFTQARDYSSSGNFPFPSGIDEVNEFVVYSILDKDHFTIATSLASTPITLSGAGTKAVMVYDFVVNEVKSKLRIKYIELNSNLYFTANDGIKKISKLNPYSISKAGGITALNVDLALYFGGSGGFFGDTTNDVEVAYRVVWGYKDVNGNLILGMPSEKAVIQNYTKQNTDVSLTFPVPSGIDITYFYQIYRTNVFTINGSGDEMRLVYQADYDGYSDIVTIIDSTPEVIRDTGTTLYTNEISGEGILQANSRPPVAEDICVYKDRAWFANTKTNQKLEMTFLGFDGFKDPIYNPSATGVPAVITLGLGHGVLVDDFIALANTTSVDGQYQVTAVTSTTVTINVDSTLFGSDYVVYRTYLTIDKDTQESRYFFVGRPEITDLVVKPMASIVSGDYFNLTSIDDKIKYSFWFAKLSTDVAPVISGRVSVKVDLYTTPPTTDEEVAELTKNTINTLGDFFAVTTTAGGITVTTNTSGAVTDVASATSVGTSLVSIATTQDGFGEDFSNGFVRLSSYISPAAAIEDTAKSLVRAISFNPESPVYAYYLNTLSSLPGTFYLEEKNFSEITFTLKGTGMQSDVSFNPSVITAASSSNNIGNNVLMFSKTQQPEAVPTVNSFRIGPQDKAIKRILGLRDSLFIFKEEGVYRLTGENESNFNIALFDNSATIIAPDSAVILNNQIYCLTTQGVSTISETGVGIISRVIEDIFNTITSENYVFSETACYGISYEADRSYIIAIPVETSDEYATVMYRYNSFTQSWTSFSIPSRCGVVNTKNKLHIGSNDITTVEVERKSLTSRDYVDREYPRVASAYSQKRIYLDNTQLMNIGDSISQLQYLTVGEFNGLIDRLKLDPQLNFNQSFPLLSLKGGADFNDAFINLVEELNLKDSSRLSYSFTSTVSNEIVEPNHGLENDDIVRFSSLTPVSLVNDVLYKVVDVDTNTFKLTNVTYNTLVKNISTTGYGVFTKGSVLYNFNLILDVNYSSSDILFPDHGLVDGDVIVYTNSTSPVVGVPPSGLVDGRSYVVTQSTSNTFKVTDLFIDLNILENGTLTEEYYYSNTINSKILQQEFNSIVRSLNSSDGVFFSNFDLSQDSEYLDLTITSVNLSQNYVTVQYESPFYIGDMVHFVAIESEVVWDYSTLGDAALLKHARNGTVMLDQNSINKITIGYASDISGDFENTEFTLDGAGQFGKSLFGNTAFGGNGTVYPLRTVIPRQKQRCRHIRSRIFHRSAFMKFNILGISYTFEVTSDRAYRR